MMDHISSLGKLGKLGKDVPISKEYMKRLITMFQYTYYLKKEEAWECALIFMEKCKFKAMPISRDFLRFAYVDWLRERFGRIYEGRHSDKNEFRLNVANYLDINHDNMAEKLEADTFERMRDISELIYILRKFGSRNMIARYRKKPISYRRVLLKSALGWTNSQIGRHVGLTESRIHQIITKETLRLKHLLAARNFTLDN